MRCIPSFGRIVFASLVLVASATAGLAEDWPQWRGPRGDGTWQAPNLVRELPPVGLEDVWRKPIGGGYAGISTHAGRIFVMERLLEPDRERVLCMDAKDGSVIWQHEYAAAYGDLTYNNGPRAAAVVHDGCVYTLGAVGHVHCFDEKTGDVLWKIDAKKQLGAERPTWGFSASPFIYQDAVILQLGLPGGAIASFDKKTGEMLWKSSDDPAGYATPIIIEHAGKPVLIHFGPEHIHGMSPDTGEMYWKIEYKVTNGVSIAPPVYRQEVLFVSASWHGAKAIRLGQTLNDAQVIWESEVQLRALMLQPMYRDGHGYLLDIRNGFTCFNWADGEKVWDDDQKMTPRKRHTHASVIWLNKESDTGGGILTLNSDGEIVHADVSPEGGYVEHWRFKVIGETWAHPGFMTDESGSYIFVRDDEQIACLKLPVAKD